MVATISESILFENKLSFSSGNYLIESRVAGDIAYNITTTSYEHYTHNILVHLSVVD